MTDIPHENPEVLCSVRSLIEPAETMQKYYGEIRRNVDAAFIYCGGNEDAICNEKIPDCAFKCKHTGICDLKTMMELVNV